MVDIDAADGGAGERRPTRNGLKRAVEARLADAGIAAADDEARWMLEEASGLEGAELIAAGREPATHQEERRIAEMVERRLGGEPIQYVLGSWSFRGLDLFVDHRVLIPRPETELVVEIALEEVERRGERRGPQTRGPGRRAGIRSPTSARGRVRSRSLWSRSSPTPRSGPQTSTRRLWRWHGRT